jgi:hypothetical protein
MKRLITLFAFLILISGELYSQAADYVFSSSTGTYSEITGTVSTATGDNGTETLSIPFSFDYCGTTYTSAIVCVNGWLELGTTYLESEESNLMASTTVKPIIAGLWDDLFDDEYSDIQYTTLGSSPNRIFVVQWRNIKWKQPTGAQENFQVRLYETTYKIEIIYGMMNNPLNFPSASIGMNDFTGGPGHFLSVTPAPTPTVSSTIANDNITEITYLTSGLTYTFIIKLNVLPDSLGYGYTAIGNSTAEQTFLLSGINLTAGPIVVTAPDGFEVSLNGTAWFETVNVSYTPPTLASTTIYARFSPTGSPSDYSGNITNVGGGDTKNVKITGTSTLCAAGSGYCDEHIGRVQVGTIDNSSDCSEGGYTDYASLSTNMYKTISYSIMVTDPNYYDYDQCGIWADWNNNGDFNDEGENITVSGGPQVFTATLTPPSNAFEGSCMLRIRIHSDEESTESCGNSFYGEVEDYSIYVVPAPVSPTFSVTPAIKKYIDSPLNHFTPDYFTQTFTVKNIGPGTLTISDAFLIGGDDTQFVLTDPNTYPLGLSGTSTIQFTVKFNPTSIGPKATTLRIQSSAKTNHDVALSGTGFIYPPQNLSAVITPENTNELSWDQPLPEGEIRYDNGVASDWFTVNYPSGADDYAFTRFTAPVNGNLNYVALFQSEDEDAPDWPEIMVCPEIGTSNTPDLNNPLATFSDVPVNSFYGEWKILELNPSSTLTAGTDFFLVVHWPPDTDIEPYVVGDIFSNTNRCRSSTDGFTWDPYSGTYLMRAYMSTNSERSVFSYNVLRGTSDTSLADYATGITTANYTDSDVFPSTTYFYGITAINSDSQLSDTSNIISLTTADIFDNLFIWTGNVSSEWNNTGNWDHGSLPDATNKVIIPTDPVSNPDRFPIITNTVNCYDINIGEGAIIIIQSPGVLNIINP